LLFHIHVKNYNTNTGLGLGDPLLHAENPSVQYIIAEFHWFPTIEQ